MRNEQITILIPAYNPDANLVTLISKLVCRFKSILIVDDGSHGCSAVFSAIRKMGVPIIAHESNRGKGAALKTGFIWISEHVPDCKTIVTADADGQHRPDDIVHVAEVSLLNPRALTLGVRAFAGRVPFRSRFGNWWTRQIFFLMTRLKVQDTQTGLRGIPVTLVPRMLKLEGSRYEYEMQMLADAKCHEEQPVEVPIETVYIEANASSHFNPLRDSVRIYGALIKFCVSSVGCFLLDNFVFTVMLYLMMRLTDWKRATCVLGAIIVARSISATVNYLCNRTFVFRSKTRKSVAFLKYWGLVLMILFVGYVCTAVASRIFDARGFCVTALKIIVETVLFFLSYNLQKRWVFKTL